MDCSLPGSSVHGIFQARVLEWGAQKSPDTPGSPEGNTEGPGTASSEPPRAEGLLFLHGLESNPGSSLQTENIP